MAAETFGYGTGEGVHAGFRRQELKQAGKLVPRLELQMGIERIFRDINGIDWRVSHAAATAAPGAGWLSFQAGHLERRLTPVPTTWQMATIQRLEQMCRIATPIQRDQTANASDSARIPNEQVPEPTADTTSAEA